MLNNIHNFSEYSVITRYESNSLHMQKKLKRFHFIMNSRSSKKRDILKRENFSDISSEGYWRQIVLNAIGSQGFEQSSSIYKALKHFSESH